MNGSVTLSNEDTSPTRVDRNGLVHDHPVLFREWAPLKHLIEKIPPKYHQGFVSKELLLTCVAVSCDSIVIGSSAGVVFWFSRSNQLACRKSIDDKFISVTALAITISEYGEALAVGNAAGVIAVFSSNISLSAPVSLMHCESGSLVSALAWDGSGLRLLSGHEDGKVLLSQFQQGILQPIRHVVAESSSIVQLRFHPLEYDLILVSSLKRALIVDTRRAPESAATQVGQKDRKYPTPFGADFGYAGNETVIYSSRPGLRLWLSDCQGEVRQTLIYKESFAAQRPKLMILSFRDEGQPCGDANFGRVYCLSNGLVVTYSPTSLFVLDPGQSAASYQDGQVGICGCSRFSSTNLRQATVFHNEIFLLLENRTLIRIADRPDRLATSAAVSVERPLLSSWRTDITKSVKPTLQSTITKLTSKIGDVDVTKPRSVASLNHGPFIMESLSNALAPLFEFKSTPPIQRHAPPKALHPHFPTDNRSPSPLSTTSDRSSPVLEVLEKVEGTPSSPALQSSPLLNGSSDSTVEDDVVYGSFVGKKRKWKLNSKSSNSALEEIVPSPPEPLPTPPQPAVTIEKQVWSSLPAVKDDLREELERKDALLATLLQLDQLSSEKVEPTTVPQPDPSAGMVAPTFFSLTGCEDEQAHHDDNDDDEDMNGEAEELNDNIYTKYANDDDSLNRSIPLICSSPVEVAEAIPEIVPSTPVIEDDCDDRETVIKEWSVCPLDAKRKITSLSSGRHYVVIVDSDKSVFYQAIDSTFQGRDWLPVDAPSSHMVMTEEKLWRIHKSWVYEGADVNPYCPFADSWTALESSVSSMAVARLNGSTGIECYLWILHSNGTLSCRSAASPGQAYSVEVPGSVKLLRCQDKFVLLLLHNGSIYSRSRVTSQSPVGAGWQRLQVPGEVETMALSPQRQLWILTRREQLFFRQPDEEDHSAIRPRWWQVVLPVNLPLNKSTRWLDLSSVFKRQSLQFDMTITETRIFLAVIGSSLLLTARNVIGYTWNRAVLEHEDVNRWRMLNAPAEKTLWLVDDKNRLYCRSESHLEQIALPTDDAIEHLAASPQHLWLVTDQGTVFIRTDSISNANEVGWTQLSTLQFQPDNQLRRISIGTNLAWACDDLGQIYFRYGDNGPPTLLSPAWLAVDRGRCPFREICVEPSGFAVWALDAEGRIYSRQGVSAQFPIGHSWLEFDVDFQAVQLSVSESSVWVLSSCGHIFRRPSRGEYTDDWDQVPGSFTSLTVTANDILLALDSKGIVYQLAYSMPLKNSSAPPCPETLHLDGDWVLL